MLKLSLARVLILIRANQMDTMHIKIAPDDNHLTFMPAVISVHVPFHPTCGGHRHKSDRRGTRGKETSTYISLIIRYIFYATCPHVAE